MDTTNWSARNWRWTLHNFNLEQAFQLNFLAMTTFLVLTIFAILSFIIIAIFIQKFNYKAESTEDKFYAPVDTEEV